MKFGTCKAVVSYDPEISMFPGEFIGFVGGADFYAENLEKLRIEGEKSLSIVKEFAKEKNISLII